MRPSKKEILLRIYGVYETWSSGYSIACQKGCAACCTQNVTMTATEGEIIIEYVKETNKQHWFVTCLKNRDITQAVKPGASTNAFARNCFGGIDTHHEEASSQRIPCTFLLPDNTCGIYPVRPFGCRCFASLGNCSTHGEASQPEDFIAINTVTMQVIEHLGQKEFWGNIYDVLLSLCELHENNDISALFHNHEIMRQAKTRLLMAEPIPGFIVMPSEQAAVEKYLNTLFQEKIGVNSLEEILNNTKKEQ